MDQVGRLGTQHRPRPALTRFKLSKGGLDLPPLGVDGGEVLRTGLGGIVVSNRYDSGSSRPLPQPKPADASIGEHHQPRLRKRGKLAPARHRTAEEVDIRLSVSQIQDRPSNRDVPSSRSPGTRCLRPGPWDQHPREHVMHGFEPEPGTRLDDRRL